MVNIVQIAKLAKKSISTVSKALNDYPDVSKKTKDEILKIASEQGYIPNATARSLVKKKTYTIGIVYEIESGLKNLFFLEVIDSFRKEIEKSEYDILLLSNQSSRKQDYVDHSRFKQLDGVLIVASGRNINALQRLRDNDMPFLTLDPPIEMKNSIYSDSYHSIYKACKYLYELGHRKIAFIHGNQQTLFGKQRFQGYLDFIEKYELPSMIDLSRQNISYSIAEGYKTMQSIFEKYGKPDAVSASSDLMAIGAMRYLKANHYDVPNDVSIVGFDNIQLCEMIEPSLSTVKQNYDQIGNIAAKLLIDMINNKTREIDPIILETEIIIRNSSIRRK